MKLFRRGGAEIIIFLVLVAIIPAIAVSVFLFRRGASDHQIKNASLLPDKTLTSVVREVREITKEGKEIRYWVLDIKSHSQDTLLNCYVALTSKGEKDIFYGFSKRFVLQDCNRRGTTRSNYECRIDNAFNKFRNSDTSRRWDRISAGGNLIVGIGSFYKEQSISTDSFLSKNKLTDIYSATAACQTSKGNWVRQEMLNPPLIPLR